MPSSDNSGRSTLEGPFEATSPNFFFNYINKETKAEREETCPQSRSELVPIMLHCLLCRPPVALEFQRTYLWFHSHQSYLCPLHSRAYACLLTHSSPIHSAGHGGNCPRERRPTVCLLLSQLLPWPAAPGSPSPGAVLELCSPRHGSQNSRCRAPSPPPTARCLLSSPVQIPAFCRPVSLFPQSLTSWSIVSPPQRPSSNALFSKSHSLHPEATKNPSFPLSQGSLSRTQVHGSDPVLCMVVQTVPQDILEILDDTDVCIGTT